MARPAGTAYCLEVHFNTQPHPAWVAGEVVETPDGVIERVRRPALFGQVEDVISVAEALLGPDESNAVRGCRVAGLVDPATAAGPRIGGSTKAQIDGAISEQGARLFGLVGVVGAVGREVGTLLRGVVDIIGRGEDLDDVLPVQDVPGLDVAGQVHSRDAKALGEPKVQILERRQPRAVEWIGEALIAVVAGDHVLVTDPGLAAGVRRAAGVPEG